MKKAVSRGKKIIIIAGLIIVVLFSLFFIIKQGNLTGFVVSDIGGEEESLFFQQLGIGELETGSEDFNKTAYLLGLFPNLNVPENETLGIILEFKNKEGLLIEKEKNPSLSVQSYKAEILSEHNSLLQELQGFIQESSVSSQVNIDNIKGTEVTGLVNALALNLQVSDLKNMTEQELMGFANLMRSYNVELHPDVIIRVQLQDSVGIIKADKVWNELDSSGNNITGKDVTIAILDSGVDYNHPDLDCDSGSGGSSLSLGASESSVDTNSLDSSLSFPAVLNETKTDEVKSLGYIKLINQNLIRYLLL